MRAVYPLILGLAYKPAETPSSPTLDRTPAPAVEVAAPQLKRLTTEQYLNSVADIFGETITITTQLDPLEEVDGMMAVGAGVSTISPLGVERFETAAYQIAEQSMADPTIRAGLVPCEPAGTTDDACARAALEPLGQQVWRRPLTEEELDILVEISAASAVVSKDFYLGLEYGIATLLQSPHFLFRVELGEADPDAAASGRRYTNFEMASRLSYLLWNTTPDDELLAAAMDDELTTGAGLIRQIDRMLDDSRSRDGMRAFFTDLFDLDALDDLIKDPLIFTYMSDDLGESAREDTLMVLENLVFDENEDYRSVFTTRMVWVNRRLAAIYDVPAPEMEGFEWVELPATGRRRGLLGQVSFLASQAHPVSTSVTLRGIFVRERLLCQSLPPPPSDIDTSIPEASEDLPTMRERVARHLEDPACASCHEITDPIGLGLENFDGIGRWRTSENDHPIDPSGEMDGESFTDAWDLAEIVQNHPELLDCLTERYFSYAAGQSIDAGTIDIMGWHADGLSDADGRLLFLMKDIAQSPAFRTVGEVD